VVVISVLEQLLKPDFAGIFYEPNKEPSGLEDPPKLHLLVESNEEWRVRRWFIPHGLILTHFVWTGRASCPGDQAPVVRSFRRCVTGGDAQPNCAGSLQRRLTIDTPYASYDIHHLCTSTLLSRNTHVQIRTPHDGMPRPPRPQQPDRAKLTFYATRLRPSFRKLDDT